MYRESHENDFSKKLAAKVMKDFCESTSLHGYSHLYVADSIVSKIVWFLVGIFRLDYGQVELDNRYTTFTKYMLHYII